MGKVAVCGRATLTICPSEEGNQDFPQEQHSDSGSEDSGAYITERTVVVEAEQARGQVKIGEVAVGGVEWLFGVDMEEGS